ncbi:neutral zinc metallopeptidase [Kribbella sp. NPDC055071]
MSNQGPYGPPPGQYQGPPQQSGPPQYGPPPGGPQYWGPPQGPPPQGPGFGWGSNGFPPPKKKSKAPWIVVPLVLVLGIGIVGLWIYGVVQKNKHLADGYSSPQPTYSSTYEPTEFPTITTAPTKAQTNAPPPPVKTTQPRPTKTTPPPPSDNDLVTKNRIYKTGVQKTVNCKESGARANSAVNARKYYNAVLACLVRAWPKQVALSGGRFVAPRMIAFTGPVVTPCSGGAPSSFYCGANRTIYMDTNGDLKEFKQYSTYNNRTEALAYLRASMTDTVAHEFGHHVQNMTGILDAEDNLAYQSNTTKALELSRRLEIQATCFGNVFMGANKSSYGMTGLLKSQLDYLHSHQGDEYGDQPDHGSRAVIPRWANAGFVTRSPSACNTFTAAATYVR